MTSIQSKNQMMQKLIKLEEGSDMANRTGVSEYRDHAANTEDGVREIFEMAQELLCEPEVGRKK